MAAEKGVLRAGSDVLVLTGLDRTRFLWRCAMVGDAWVSFFSARKRAMNPLPLITQLARLFADLAGQQKVSLSWGVDQLVPKVLGQPVGSWLAGGGEDRIIQSLGSNWRLTGHGRSLMRSVTRIQFKKKERTALIKACAYVAIHWGEAGSRNDRKDLWDILSEDFGEVPPAEGLLELLLWPVSWWLEDREEGALLFSDGQGGVQPTPAAVVIMGDEP